MNAGTILRFRSMLTEYLHEFDGRRGRITNRGQLASMVFKERSAAAGCIRFLWRLVLHAHRRPELVKGYFHAKLVRCALGWRIAMFNALGISYNAGFRGVLDGL